MPAWSHPGSRPLRRPLLAAALALLLAACGTAGPPGPAVTIVEPADGAVVGSPFKLRFEVSGLVVAPAGEVVPGSGHHHLLINTDPLPAGTAVPFDERHLHFGKGQTSSLLDLPAGKHTLRLLFADHEHRPYFVFSPEITVEATKSWR